MEYKKQQARSEASFGQQTTRELPEVGSEAVRATIAQGFDANINVRIVPGRDFKLALKPKHCKPRQSTPRPNFDLAALPADLVKKLRKADKKMVAWLTQDQANAARFLEQPAESLAKAGIELTRSEQKLLHRTHEEVRNAAVVPPGANIKELNTTVFPKGRVGKIKPGAKPKDGKSKIGCVKE
jgi:hypothetical protein